jgi:hypothetical protein
MAHFYNFLVMLPSNEQRGEIQVAKTANEAEAAKLVKALQDVGEDAFVDKQVIWVHESYIVNELMFASVGDYVFGVLERKLDDGRYDIKSGILRPDGCTEEKFTSMHAYMEKIKLDGTILWKLTADGIMHYLNYHDVEPSLAAHLRRMADERAKWADGYVARLFVAHPTKPADQE